MGYPNYYWQRDKDAPFAFFVGIVNAYCHPETGADEQDLVEWVHRPDPSQKTTRFKDEFRRLLSGELDQLPKGALGTAAEYEDGSDEVFLRRLWHEIYGDEPVTPAAPS
jgi:hypothetical protein